MKIEIHCPAMAVRHRSYGLSVTDMLCADFFIGDIQDILVFPKTYVRMRSRFGVPIPWIWDVDPVQAILKKPGDLISELVSNLPKEKCSFKVEVDGGLHAYMLAASIDAPTELTLPIAPGDTQSIVLHGIVNYPAAKATFTSKGVLTVEPVVATGDLV